MQATTVIPRELATLFGRLVEMERMASTQEWWMFGRVLPEARRVAEIASLLTAARAELGQMLETLGHPQSAHIEHPATGELAHAQQFASDERWAEAHREEARSVIRLAAMTLPHLQAQLARFRCQVGESTTSGIMYRGLERVGERLSEARSIAFGY